MALQSENFGINLNFPVGGITATAAAVTVTVGTGGLTASNNGVYLNLTAGAKTPVYLTNVGAVQAVPPNLLSGTITQLVNGSSSSINYGQGAIVVFGLANLATVNGVANTPVGFDQSGTITLVAIVGPIANLDQNGNLIGAVNPSGTAGGNGELTFPDVPDLVTPVGYFTVKNPPGSSTATFTFGTTNWNATSITTTAYNIVNYPLRPKLTF